MGYLIWYNSNNARCDQNILLNTLFHSYLKFGKTNLEYTKTLI